MSRQGPASATGPTDQPRYAIYFTPPAGSLLARFGARWLASGGSPAVPGLTREKVDALMQSAERYGFHATLKAPFILAPGVELGDLVSALERFAKTQAPVIAPPLHPATLGAYVALRPSATCPALDALAAECVRQFDGYRASLEGSDLTRRRAGGLTQRQDGLLQAWGYPYVMEEFRCHMTLAGPAAANEISMLLAVAALRSAGLREEPLAIDALSLVAQRNRDAPFHLVQRIPLTGTT